jgi:SAM-dependent methyltransferase
MMQVEYQNPHATKPLIMPVLVQPNTSEDVIDAQVHPDTLAAARGPELFHLNFPDIETLLPPEKVEAGGYTLLGGGVSVGITALVLAYAMGFRKLHLFGYDSCNRDGKTHAYAQPQNAFMPNIDVIWAGKTYNASMAMKLQAEAFLKFAEQLKEEGCEITVYGDGLLQAMYLREPMTEREKYQKLWADPRYRALSPGERIAPTFVDVAKPGEDDVIIDFGCGTGRGGLAVRSLTGCRVIGVDFTDNCRDLEASTLPFLQHDLTKPLTIQADLGFCADVMEHIPPVDVMRVILNIMGSVPRCFFQIATTPDQFGATIGQPLHLTVKSGEWWLALFEALDFAVEWSESTTIHASFLVHRTL